MTARARQGLRRLTSLLTQAACVGCAWAALASAANAQTSCTLTVTTLADDSSAGSLRTALVTSNTTSGNRICFASGLQGTITLASPLSITNGVTIAGNGTTEGVGPITISGHNGVQDFVIDDTSTDSVHINGLTIIDGAAQQGGAVLVSAGNVTLSYDQIQGNQAVTGGAIYNQGTLTLSNTTVATSSSTDDSGGGIYNASGGTLVMTGSVVNSNSTPGLSGGGLENQGTATITGGNFTGNAGSPGAAIDNYGQLTVSGVYFYSNTSGQGGGAIENQYYGTVSVTGSSFIQNATKTAYAGSTTNGGAINNAGGVVTVHESTFSGNTADGEGGALYNSGLITLVQDTITANNAAQGGSGAFQAGTENSNPITLTNTIVSGNTTDDCSNCGTIPAGNLVGGTAMLGPLAINVTPGPLATTANLPTYMPLPGSPAIGGGIFPAQEQTDERGLSRTTLVGVDTLLLDIGAVQTHYNSVTFSTQPTSTLPNTAITPPVQVQVVEKDGSTTNYPQGVPVTMLLLPVGQQPTATLNGAVVENPTFANNVVSAVFSNLSVSAAGDWQLQATTYPTTQNAQTATYSSISSAFTTSTQVTMTQTSLGLSPVSPVYGTPETLTAYVTQYGTSTPVQSGSVAFTDNGAPLSTVQVTNGQAVLSGVTLTLGANLLVASYTGNSTYGASGGGGTFYAKATPTVTVVTPPAILPGAALTAAMLHGTATGVNQAALAGSYSYSPALGTVLSAGSHTITATFTPADTTDYVSGTGSATLTVLTPTASLSSLSVSPSPANAGTAETLTGRARAPDGVPGVVNGTMAFSGGTASGSQPLTLVESSANFSLPGSSTSFNTYSQLVSYSADLNGDGVADQVFAADYEIGQVEVLFSDPAHPGSYLSQLTLGTYDDCSYVTGVAIGDVDGDGLPDIVAACYQGNYDVSKTSTTATGPIILYLNQGNGSFAAPVNVTGTMSGASVVLADFDGDQKLDLVSIAPSCGDGASVSCIAFQHGNGDGTFNAASYTHIEGGSTYDSFENLLVADFNGDAVPDLGFLYFAQGTGSGQIVVWTTNKSPQISFGEYNGSTACSPGPCDPNKTINPTPSGSSFSFLAAADLNGDGLADLAAVTTDGGSGAGDTVYTALNQLGNGAIFLGATSSTVYAGAESLAIADFNQDGIADLVLYSGTANTIQVYDGDGTGAFHNNLPGLNVPVSPPEEEETRHPTTASGTRRSLRPAYLNGALYPVFNIGDVNGDGFPDILFAQSGYYTATAQLAITSGPTQAAASTTAPAQSTTYTGTTTPPSKPAALWTGSNATALLTVNQAPVVTLSWQPAPFTYGMDVPASDLQATATVNGQSATGTFVYTFTSGTSYPYSGSQINTSTIYPAAPNGVRVQVAFTPTGSTETYTLGTSLTINQATPSVTLVTPPELLPGAKLSTANLHATATGVGGALLAGNFTYSQALGSVPAAGSQTVTATFTPADTTDYTTGSYAQATFTVLAAQATATNLVAAPNPAVPGAAVTLSATVAPAGTAPGIVSGQVTFPAGASPATASLSVAGAQASFVAAGTAVAAGSTTIQPTTYTADFNGDGLADMLVLAQSYYSPATLTLLLDQAPGANYGAPLSLALDANCPTINNVAIGDLNGDGLPDIVAACENSALISFEVLLNQGGGHFAAALRITDPNGAFTFGQRVGVGDFNADGKLDVVVVGARCGNNCTYNTLVFEPGDGTGHFGAPVYTRGSTTGETGFGAPVVADFDGDGLPDLAFVVSGTTLQVWRDNGGAAATFGASCGANCFNPSAGIAPPSSSYFAGTPVAADLRSSGHQDLAVIATADNSSGNSLAIALNASTSGTIAFPATATGTVIAGAAALAAGDFDRDGHVDFAVFDTSDYTIRVYEGDGTGAFQAKDAGLAVTLPQAASSSAFAAADANGDGAPDLLLAQTSGQGTFTAQNYITSGPSVATSSITAPSASTTYTATATPSVPYWAASAGTTSLAITLLPTQTSLGVSPTIPTYGMAVTLTAKVAVPSLGSTPATGGSVTFTEDGTLLPNPVSIDATGTATYTLPNTALPNFPTAGKHVFGASYSGSSVDSPSNASSVNVPISPYTPTITWPTPTPITTTTPLGAAQLDAYVMGLPGSKIELPGTSVYTPPAGTLLTAGTHTLTVTFTPTDTVDYTTATATVQILVNNTNTQTTLAIAPTTSIYGTPLTLTADVTNTTGKIVVQGGTVVFTSTTNGVTVTLGSVTVVNGVASLTGQTLPAGSHVIAASYTGTSGEDPSAAESQTITVGKATPTLTWPTPASITTTTPLSSTQLDATAAGVGNVALTNGSFVYTPAAGATLPAGTQTLNVVFTPSPSDATNYTTASASVQIQVTSTATRTSLTVSAEQSTYGTPLTLTAHVSNTTGTTPVNTGTVTFSANSTTLSTVAVSNGIATLSGVTLPAGSPVLLASYTGTSPGTNSSGTNIVTISKATPVLTWPVPAQIATTTPLSATQLDATAAGIGNVALTNGSFVYTPAAGATLPAGTQTLNVVFTPSSSDASNYTTASASVQIQVVTTNTRTTLTVAPAQVTYGQTLTLSALVVNTNSSSVIQTGSVVFASDNVTLATVSVVNGAASLSGVSLAGGPHLLTASYTGATGEGPSAAAGQTITVARFAPVLTWPTPAQITTTTPLGATQLDATAAGLNGVALPGTFTYTPAAGTLLTAGAHSLSVTFTPTDSTDYATANSQVTIQVVAETITLTSISPTTTLIGSSPLPVTLTGSGFPSGSVVRLNGTTLPTTPISTTQLGATIPAANLGKPGTLSLTIYDAGSQATSNAVNLTVTAPTPTVTVTAPATVSSGDQPSVSVALANAYPVDLAGTLTLSFTPAGPDGVDDPAVQFETGGRTLNFTIPAGSTAGPTTAVVAGTVEGTIAIATQLTENGVNVTPPDLATPINISVTPSAPTITGVTFTDANGLLTIVVTGYSNTREMTQAQFTFTGPGAGDLSAPGVILPADSLFGTWYGDAASAQFGSTFSYTQTFQLSDPTTNITGATVTLTNTVGSSASVNSQ